jgi:hypothetical protein
MAFAKNERRMEGYGAYLVVDGTLNACIRSFGAKPSRYGTCMRFTRCAAPSSRASLNWRDRSELARLQDFFDCSERRRRPPPSAPIAITCGAERQSLIMRTFLSWKSSEKQPARGRKMPNASASQGLDRDVDCVKCGSKMHFLASAAYDGLVHHAYECRNCQYAKLCYRRRFP